MWCPEGFVLLSEIRDTCWDLAEGHAQKLRDSGGLEGCNAQYWEVVSGLSTWLFARFVDTNSGHFFAALPSGLAVRLAEHVTEISFPIEEVFEASERNLRYLERIYFEGLFAAIETECFTIDIDSDPKRSKRLLANRSPEKLRPLSGSPICFSEADDFLKKLDLLLNADGPGSNDASTGPGRRKIRLNAAREYFSIYPEGHERAGVSLSAAAIRLGYDRRTLRDGIKEYNTARDFDGE